MPSLSASTDSLTPDNPPGMLALKSVLGSQIFSDMPRLRRFLEYIVTETIAGNGGRLKGVVIACDVFDKTDPDEAQSTTIVRVEAGRLRRRLSDYYRDEGKNDPVRISIPKGGYVAAFKEVATNAPESTKQVAKTELDRPWSRTKIFSFVLVLLLSLVTIVIAWNTYTSSADEQSQALIPGLVSSKPIIAVLPFRNMVDDDQNESIAYGLTEDIITDLGGLASLEVIAMTSVLAFKDLDIKPPEISAKLGANYILNGSVRGFPPDLRITAQLYDAINGMQAWSARFDRQMTSELDLQDELARQVVNRVSIHLQGDENVFPSSRRNTDSETWSLFKQAMNIVNPPSDPARLELSLQAFNQVIQHDKEFAGGFAGAAYVYAFKAFFGHSKSREQDVLTALDMAARSQSLDPAFGLSYSAQAFAYLVDRNFQQALTASAKAIEFAPNDPYVQIYHGFMLTASGDSVQGISFAETAIRLDPLNARTPYLNILGVINFQAGNYELALQAFKKNQERGGPLGPGIQNFVAAAQFALGESNNAVDTLRVADLLDNGKYDWENWVRQSWKNQQDSDHILKLVKQIRDHGSL